MGCSKFIKCKHPKTDCFANKNGLCICLADTNFIGKDGKVTDCTFYKPIVKHQEERRKYEV